MNQTVPAQAKGQKHLFVHSVRFWSMLCIVALHSFVIVDLQARQTGYAPSFAVECGLQVFKFATISFFLISGFLLGERLPQHGALKYFKRRLKNVGAPWLFWFSLCVVVSALRTTLVQGNNWHVLTHASVLLNQLYMTLNFTAFWFVPNLLLALACLLVLRRWIDSPWVGVILGFFTLLYCVNLYKGWLPTEHTEALLGFVFFLWLGAWTSRHGKRFKQWLESLPLTLLLGSVIVTFALSVAEAWLLRSRTSEALAEFNTIRLSNVLFSIAGTLAIMRIPRRSWPKFVDPEKTTYGIYLVHVLALSFLSGMRRYLHLPASHSVITLYANWLVTFLAAYLMSVGVVYLMSLTSTTATLIGIKRAEAKPPAVPAPASFAEPTAPQGA